MNAVAIAFNHISAKRRRPWANEEEVRVAWINGLESALSINIDLERAKKDGRYNNIVIEFKAPGLFNGSKSSPKFKEATEDRLLKYIKRESAKSGMPREDYIGIAIDGDCICFAQVRGDSIETQHLVPFSEYAVGLVVAAFRADTRRAITVDNIVADFGHRSDIARSLMQALSDGLSAELASPSTNKIKMLFEEWRALYGQVADMSVLQAAAISDELGFTWNGEASNAMAGRLFVIHSYNSLIIKLLAAEIISAHGLTATRQPAQAMAALLDDSALLNSLDADIEHAGIFVQAGLNGFVEEAIFSWYLDAARTSEGAPNILSGIRSVLAALSVYRTDYMTNTRDVLRGLYQGLVPSKFRQSLGEFYTPDWLVDLTIDRLEVGSWLNGRFLDPTCGSGAFLVAIVRRIRREAQDAGWSADKTVQHLCSSVWGFDLNPLAVQTARVNFLLEIADLLRDAPGRTLEVPVLLADAIYSPAPDPGPNEEVVHYQIGSQVAGLKITLPSPLAFDRIRLDQVFSQMGDDVENNQDYGESERHLQESALISPEEARLWRAPLKNTYDQILKLHQSQWNGIWFRIVRNFFWSATAGNFDFIVGNPPWVRWSKLPDTYRERVKPTCERYGIFSKNKRHGGNELDISAMITYTTSDKWLKTDGRIAFVITGTLFKNPSSAGFREFKLEPDNPNSCFLVPVSVDDMKALKPFSDAANHTTVVVLDKSNHQGTYPVPYRLWNSLPDWARAIPTNALLSEVENRTSIISNVAAPVGECGSPWSVLPPGRFEELKALSEPCSWVAGRKGITTDLNGVYFIPVTESNDQLVKIHSRPDAGKKNIGVVKSAWVEPDLLYPLIKGAGDFEACYLRLNNPSVDQESLYTFLPNTGIDGASYTKCEAGMNSAALRRTKAWFASYKNLLENRSTYRRQMKGAPYYAVYNVGDYTLQPWKVIWPEMCTNFFAAVAGSSQVPLIGNRPFVPDHKIYFAAFKNKEPAYFLCGLLNSSIVREWVESHNVSIQMGDIFKHMNLPEFDPSNEAHNTLSALVEACHNEHDESKRSVLLDRVQERGNNLIEDWISSKTRGVGIP